MSWVTCPIVVWIGYQSNKKSKNIDAMQYTCDSSRPRPVKRI